MMLKMRMPNRPKLMSKASVPDEEVEATSVKPSRQSIQVSEIDNKLPKDAEKSGMAFNIAEILETEYQGINLYTVTMIILVIAILWTGIGVVEQVQTYHHRYGELLSLKKEFRQLQIERQRMLIEQQTFSATPQITNRAITELNMYYPELSERLIIHADKTTQIPSPAATASDSATPDSPTH